MTKKNLPKLILRDDLISKEGKARIEFLLYYNRKQYRISSGQSIEPKFWIAKQECVDRKSDNASDINQLINDRLSKFENYLETKRVLNQELLLEEMRAILKGEEYDIKKELIDKKNFPTITEAFNFYIEAKNMRQGTKTNYLITNSILRDFCKRKYKSELTIDEINCDFLDQFQIYLSRSRNNNKTTIAKRLKIFKTTLRYSRRKGYKIDNPFDDYDIDLGIPNRVTLTEKEYKLIKNTPLPEDASDVMKLSWFIFIFEGETAFRFSDIMDLSWSQISPDLSDIEKYQVKTDAPVYQPLSNQAKAILEKFQEEKYPDNKVFPRISINTVNIELKKIAKNAGVTKNLSTHVARRTYGTMLGASGLVSAFAIAELMGHKDVAMTQKYVNLSKSDLNNTMQRFWDSKKNSPDAN